MFERFTEHGRQVIVLAQDEARSLGHEQVGSEHLLLGLVRQDDDLFELLGDPADLRARVVELVGHGDSASPEDMRFSEHAMLVMKQVAAPGGARIGPHELALAVLALPDDATALRALRAHGVSPAAARDEIAAIRDPAAASHDEQGGLEPRLAAGARDRCAACRGRAGRARAHPARARARGARPRVRGRSASSTDRS